MKSRKTPVFCIEVNSRDEERALTLEERACFNKGSIACSTSLPRSRRGYGAQPGVSTPGTIQPKRVALHGRKLTWANLTGDPHHRHDLRRYEILPSYGQR